MYYKVFLVFQLMNYMIHIVQNLDTVDVIQYEIQLSNIMNKQQKKTIIKLIDYYSLTCGTLQAILVNHANVNIILLRRCASLTFIGCMTAK